MAIALDETAVTDFRRDRWGRLLIVPADGGKAIPYQRSSSAVNPVEDHWNLEMWARGNIVYGTAHDQSLIARVLAVGGNPGTWTREQKQVIRQIHEDAQQVAQAHKAANIGTAIHSLTEALDRGEPVASGLYQADLDAYRTTLDAAGFTCHPEWVECRMVCDELEMAGTADRIVTDTDSRHFIADLKTSASVDYGGLGWAGQLAAYAHGHLYDVTTDQRLPTPYIGQTTGIIIHLPAGQGICTLYEIDLVAGYRAAQLANEIRSVRKESKRWITVLDTAPPVSDQPPALVPGGVAPPAPTSTVDAGVEHDRRQTLRARYKALSDDDKQRFLALDAGFDLDAVEAALNSVDPFTVVIPPTPPAPPAPPAPPMLPVLSELDEGASVPRKDFDVLRDAHAALPDDRRRWVGDIISQSRRADVSIAPWPGEPGTVRIFELLAGLIALAGGVYVDNQLVVELAAEAYGTDLPFHASTAGQAVGILDGADPATFAELCRAVVDDPASVDIRLHPAAT